MELNEHNVALALQAASSRNYEESRAASNQLEEWHKVEGFHSRLQDLYLRDNIPPELRLVTLLSLKNGVEKYWRRGANNALNANEQTVIRSRLLEHLFDHANDTRFTSVQAVVVAKVARNDFPDTWPTFFEDVSRMLDDPRNDDNARLEALLTTIRHAIKEFGTLRLQKPKHALYAASPGLYDALWRHYRRRGSAFPHPQDLDDKAHSHAQYFRCLRRLSVIGFELPHRSPQVCEVWRFSLKALPVMLAVNAMRGSEDDMPAPIAAHIGQLVKFHLTLAQAHPVSFALMENIPELVQIYWTQACDMRDKQKIASASDPFADFFCLKALLMLRACFKVAYTPLQTLKVTTTKEDPEKARNIMRQQLLGDDFVHNLFDGLVSRFLVYTPGDVEEWLDEAEEWEIKESDLDDAYELSPRPCAERLLMDITLHHKDSITTRLLDLVMKYSDSEDVFIKDAIYAALGATAPMINQAFDFNTFLRQRLVPDLQNGSSSYSLIRRRIAILLAQWTPIAVSNENKALVYTMFVELLEITGGTNDQVVRITAGKRFKDISDDFGFQPDAFVGQAPKILEAVVMLIREVTIPDTRLSLLSTLQVIVERMEGLMLPFADQVVALLEPLWQELEKEQQMKKSVIGILNMLVRSLGADSSPLQSLLLPIIKSALEPGSETQLYLLEDSLGLFADLITQSISSSPELLSVVPLLFPILELETALCSKALDILNKLLLLDPQALLQDEIRHRTLRSLTPLLSVRCNELVESTIRYVENLIRTAQMMIAEHGVMTVSEDLLLSGFLRTALDCVHGCWASHQTTGPKRRDPPPDARSESYYLIILARIIMADNSCFMAVIQSWCRDKGRDFDSAIAHILEEWFSQMDNIGDPTRTKLMCLALTQLLDTGESWILSKLQDLVALWTTIVLELRDGPEDVTGDSLVYPAPDPATYDPQRTSPHEKREAKLTYSDPVHTVNLGQSVRHHLLNVIARCGGEEAFKTTWLLNVDADLLKSFEESAIM